MRSGASRPARAITGALVLPALLAVAGTAAANPPRELTVEEAVRIARSRHPSVETQRAAVAIARARVQQSVAGFLPFLTGGFAYQPQTANLVQPPALLQATSRGTDTVVDSSGRPVSVLCATPGQGSCATPVAAPASLALQSYWTATVGISWNVWDWGRSIYGYRSARDLARSAESGVTTAERDVALNARLAFFQAIAAEEQIKVGEESAQTYRRQLDQIRALHDAGLRTKIDVATAESGLASAELTLARARAGSEMARAALAAALGEESASDWRLRFDPAAFESRPEDQARARIPEPELAETALRRRTELTELELQARGYADQARSQRGQYLPQLTLGATPSWAGERLSSMIGNLTLSISLAYPLGGMSPLLVHGQIREAEGNLLSARARERAERVGIHQELRNARALLAAADEEVRSAHRLVEAATAQRDLAIGRYASGVGTIIELQNALLNDATARFQLVQAGYDLTAARAQLQHALGEDD